jgi:hypothetical protein
MENFKVVATLDSDTGKHKLNFEMCLLNSDSLIAATSKACDIIRRSQNCPESAIKDLKLTRIRIKQSSN